MTQWEGRPEARCVERRWPDYYSQYLKRAVQFVLRTENHRPTANLLYEKLLLW